MLTFRFIRRSFAVPLRISVLLALVCLVSACAAGRINQFKEFSQAGIAYANVTGLLIEEAGGASIDGDSTILISQRGTLTTEAARQKEVTNQNALLKQRLSLLADLRRHANLLKAYFVQLGALAEDDVGGDIGSSADGVFQALGGLSDRIKNAQFGGFSVSTFIGPIVDIVVANFQKKTLEHELKKRAETLERELEVQQAAMTFISEELKADLQIQLSEVERQKIIDPFKSSAKLPASWKKDRREVLTSTLSLSTVAATSDAAKNLKMSFVALVEGRRTNVTALVQDIGELVVFLESITEDEGD